MPISIELEDYLYDAFLDAKKVFPEHVVFIWDDEHKRYLLLGKDAHPTASEIWGLPVVKTFASPDGIINCAEFSSPNIALHATAIAEKGHKVITLTARRNRQPVSCLELTVCSLTPKLQTGSLVTWKRYDDIRSAPVLVRGKVVSVGESRAELDVYEASQMQTLRVSAALTDLRPGW